MRRAASLFLLALLLAASLPGPAASAGPPEVGYIVGFHATPDEARRGEYAGGRVERVDEALRFAVVQAADARGFEARLAHDPNVRYARVDDADAYSAAWVPGDPRAAEQHAWARVNASGAWDVTRGSASIVVAVLDSGIERSHEDLAGRVLVGYDWIGRDSDPQDDCGHGTHVAGTLGATIDNGKGIAGAAQTTILPVKVLSNYCRGSWSQIASGIRYAADEGAHVISMSLGCGVSCYDQATADAIDYAWGKGALVVVAAGNEGPCESCIGFPASHARSLAVGCTDALDARCAFGSAGADMVVAPGKDILSTTTGNGYGLNSGTSMSAPHVSGAAALALATNPSLTNAQLRALIEASARDLGVPGADGAFGHGLLDMGTLVAAALAPAAPQPLPTRAVDLAPSDSNLTVKRGGSAIHSIVVRNAGAQPDTILLTKIGTASGWKTTLSTSRVTLEAGATAVVTLTVRAPRSAAAGSGLDVQVVGASADGGATDVTATRTTTR